jgi:hypothetical protein
VELSHASNILKSKGGHVARQIHLWRSTNFSFAFSLPSLRRIIFARLRVGYDQWEEGVPQAGTILALPSRSGYGTYLVLKQNPFPTVVCFGV